jgi:anaerobic selenocysteine-containing dehydrogenase
MTNSYNDMQYTKCAMYIGSNAAEAHPVSMLHMLHAKETGAKMIVVDPRFTRTAANADLFMQIRAGTDIAFLGGLIHYAIANNRIARDYLAHFTNAFAESGGVFGAIMSVQAEGHLQFVDRLRCDAGGENLVQPFERKMIPLEAPHAFFDGEPGLHGVFHGADAGQAWEIAIRLVGVHTKVDGSVSQWSEIFNMADWFPEFPD